VTDSQLNVRKRREGRPRAQGGEESEG